MDTAPATTPVPSEAAALAMEALIVAPFSAATVIAPATVTVLPRSPTGGTSRVPIQASVTVRMTLIASAPAPATPTPRNPAPTAALAAAAVAVIVASSIARTLNVPAPAGSASPSSVGSTTVTLAEPMWASVRLKISLRAVPAPTARATPVAPKPAARATAPTVAVIVDLSWLFSATPSAVTPVSRVPSIDVAIVTRMRLVAVAPAPPRPTPAPPPATAADPATTPALIVLVAVARSESRPAAVTSVSTR